MGGGGGGGGQRLDWRIAGGGGGVSSRAGTGECERMALTARSARKGDTQRCAAVMGDTDRFGRGLGASCLDGAGMYGSSAGGGGGCGVGAGVDLGGGAAGAGGWGCGCAATRRDSGAAGAAGSDTRRVSGVGLGGAGSCTWYCCRARHGFSHGAACGCPPC